MKNLNSVPQQGGLAVDCGAPNKALGQPESKFYRVWYRGEGYGAAQCEVVDEEEVEAWFFHRFEPNEQPDSHHLLLRIDNLTKLGDTRSLDQIPLDEFFALAREVKDHHLAMLDRWRSVHEDRDGQQHDVVNDSPKQSEGISGQLISYRIWYWYSLPGCLVHEAENEEKLAEWIQASKAEEEFDLRNFTVVRIEEIGKAEFDRLKKHGEETVASAAEPSCVNTELVLAEHDFFGELRKQRDKLRAEREMQD